MKKAKIFWNIICELGMPLFVTSLNIASSRRERLYIILFKYNHLSLIFFLINPIKFYTYFFHFSKNHEGRFINIRGKTFLFNSVLAWLISFQYLDIYR